MTVDLYLTDYSGFTLRHLSPFESVHVGKLAAGESHTVSRRLPDIVGKHRVSAVTYGMAGKERYADTAYVMITPLVITKLLPLTGVTLPLVSYGGSSLVSTFLSMGILLGISSMNAEDEARDIEKIALREEVSL